MSFQLVSARQARRLGETVPDQHTELDRNIHIASMSPQRIFDFSRTILPSTTNLP